MGTTARKAQAQARQQAKAQPSGQARQQAGGQARAQTTRSRQKLAARQAAEPTAAIRSRRLRLLLAGGSVTLVLVLVAVLIVAKLGHSDTPVGSSAAQVNPRLAAEVASVPAATFATVGTGSAAGLAAISGQPELTSGGKPEVLYVGGEFCPYCAAERWALAAALSRFGTLSGLTFIHSSPTDGYVPTLSFYKSGYTSKYLAFDPVEWYGEAADPNTPFQHAYLQQPTAQQAELFARYANSSLPFVDIGNRYVVPQAQYAPTDIESLSWSQVAAAMHDPSSQVARDIDGAANMLTASMCVLTHGQPGGVCTSAGVKAAAGSL